jgi:hypothetical protein
MNIRLVSRPHAAARTLIAALLFAVSTCALAWEFGFSAPVKGFTPDLPAGGQLNLIQKLNLWPGPKLVKPQWFAPGQYNLAYMVWAGQASPPSQNTLVGPFSDGSHSGAVAVPHSLFPHPGKWQVTVKSADRPDLGGDYRYFNVLPAVPNKKSQPPANVTVLPGGPIMPPAASGQSGDRSGNAPSRTRIPPVR